MSFVERLRQAVAQGRLVEMEDGTANKIKNKYSGILEPLDKYMIAPCGEDFFKYARKICKPLQWHPKEQRVATHENLWPGRKLRILFIPGGKGKEVWTTGCVHSWEEVTSRDAGEITGRVEWLLKVEFAVDIKNIQPGSLVRMHGLQSASGPEQQWEACCRFQAS
jgi:hypothetical protein